MMTLFSRADDPWSHRTRIVLAEKSIHVETIDVQGGNLPEDLLDLNPYHTVPTLVDRDLVLYDSRVIIEYLDERFPHPPLMALREAAQRVDAHIRGSDAAARFGGDEFVVLAPGITPEQAAVLAERIRLAVSETPLELQPGVQLGMTVSIGVAGTLLSRDEADLKAAAERLLADADSALYRAKQKGRNRVELA